MQLVVGALWSTGIMASGGVAEAAKAPDTVGVRGSWGRRGIGIRIFGLGLALPLALPFALAAAIASND